MWRLCTLKGGIHTITIVRRIRTIALFLILLIGVQAPAQKKFVRQILRVDSMMMIHYRSAKIDTNYVMRPQTRWTLSGRFNVAGSTFDVEGVDQGLNFRTKMQADYKSTLSAVVNYLGISVALSLNPAKIAGKYSDYELGLVYYGKHYGGDLFYQEANNYTGYYEQDGSPRIELPANNFKMRTLNMSGYWVFNHHRFSYPAAMTQGYIQRRSAGSFLLALSGQGQHGEYMGDPGMHLRITNIGLGGGYGYNFVPARRWLLHISALPTFIVYSHTSLTYDDARIPLHYHFPEVIITGRAAIVYQIKKNQFAALSAVYYFTDIGSKKELDIQNQKWRTRLTYGVRL